MSQRKINVSNLAGWGSLSSGNHSITIKAKADGYRDSEASGSVTIYKEPITISLTNLINPSNFNLSNVTESGGVYTFNTATTAMINQSLSEPIVGHIYYGRCQQLVNSGFSCGDGRFEYFGGDGDGKNIVFATAFSATQDGVWHSYSSNQAFPSILGSDWILRSFIVNGTTLFQRKEMLMIDLTISFGVGNEPTAAWCDEHIDYFTGTTTIVI